MDATVVLSWCANLCGALLRASWEGGLVLLAIWGLTRLIRRLPAWAHAALWWLGCLRLVVGLLAPAPINLPLLPAAPPSSLVVEHTVLVPPLPRADTPRPPARDSGTPPRPARPPLTDVVAALALAVWAVVVARRLRRLGGQQRQARALLDASEPAADARVVAAAVEIAADMGLRRLPRLRVADGIASPLAIGLLRPAVLLPAAGRDRLSTADLQMALAHELAHLKRADLWFGLVPAAVETLFFFHPLVRLAAREFALAREAACDAVALGVTGAEPDRYSRLLLRFGVAPHRSPAVAVCGASTHFHSLKRRLLMLYHVSPRPQRRSAVSVAMIAAAAALVLLPWRVVAKAPSVAPPARVVPAPAVPPTPAVAPTPVVAPTLAVPRAPLAPPSPPVLGAPPTPPAPLDRPSPPEPLPAAHKAGRTTTSEQGDHDGDALDEADDDASYLLHTKDGVSFGFGRVETSRTPRGQNAAEFLYARQQGRAYVITDPAVLKAARALLEPLRAPSRKQEELGARQTELGHEQAKLGAKMAELGVQSAKLAVRQAELQLAQARQAAERKTDADGRALEKAQEELERQHEALEREHEPIGEQMEALSRQMEALGDEQEKLGNEQEKLGEQQELLAEQARARLHDLVREAVSRGTAVNVDE